MDEIIGTYPCSSMTQIKELMIGILSFSISYQTGQTQGCIVYYVTDIIVRFRTYIGNEYVKI